MTTNISFPSGPTSSSSSCSWSCSSRPSAPRTSRSGHLHLPRRLIAAAKAVLIGLFFMHLYYRHRLTWVVSIAALLWLGILLALTLSDYLWRGWLDILGK